MTIDWTGYEFFWELEGSIRGSWVCSNNDLIRQRRRFPTPTAAVKAFKAAEGGSSNFTYRLMMVGADMLPKPVAIFRDFRWRDFRWRLEGPVAPEVV